MVMKEPETLMNFRPKNTYEKLLWERHMNKVLTEEKKQALVKCGELQSELDELKDRMKKSNIGALILKNKELRLQGQNKDAKIKKLKADYDELMQTLVRLQTTGSVSRSNPDEKGGEDSTSTDPSNL